ncbi:MAG: hypothetical protein PQJ46_06420 [Spirochaetales bacterium]|nr:hypothetical protein [Spirochaetales bacterium]
MKKILLTILLIISVILPVAAGDFGITIDASPTIEYDTGSTFDISALTYTAKAALWGNTAIGENLIAEFQGGYTIEDDRIFLLELDQLQLGGSFVMAGGSGGFMAFKAGRLSFSEFSGKVFAHTGDGLSIEWGLPLMTISAFGTYTGLLQAPSSTIIMNNTDLDASNNSTDTDSERVFWGPLASPRVIEGVTITFPEIIAQQTIIISGVFQQDLRQDEDLVSGDYTLDTIYAGFGLVGPIPIIQSLFYSLYSYGSTGWYDTNVILAGIAGGSINYFIPTFLASRIVIEGLISSGDSDQSDFYEGNTSGFSTAFVPITTAPAGVIFTAQQTNLFYFSGTYSMKPFANSKNLMLNNILIALKGTGFFRTTTGAISTGGVSSSSSSRYLGTEINLNIISRLLSDVGLSMSGGIFLPSAAMDSTTPVLQASMSLSLSI